MNHNEAMSDDEAVFHFARLLRAGRSPQYVGRLLAAQARRRLNFLDVDGAWAWRKEQAA